MNGEEEDHGREAHVRVFESRIERYMDAEGRLVTRYPMAYAVGKPAETARPRGRR